MLSSGLALSKRLEGAEARACRQFADATRKAFPERGTEWMKCAGAYAVFCGIDSPVTQTFGLGIFEELTTSSLDQIEQFFFTRGASVDHEVSPFAGVPALTLLCDRRYRPIEVSSVLYRAVEQPPPLDSPRINVRMINDGEGQLWADISARGWAADYPEHVESIRQFGVLAAGRENSPCFLAAFDGQPGAAGVLSIFEGVALFGGSSTVPQLRRRGLQSALLRERMRYAFDQGCDLAMMVAEVGGNSQRNAERQGFQVAYTRMKWRLPHPTR
jgi:GNAT superfamily N-acetyltransferase